MYNSYKKLACYILVPTQGNLAISEYYRGEISFFSLSYNQRVQSKGEEVIKNVAGKIVLSSEELQMSQILGFNLQGCGREISKDFKDTLT